MDKCDCCGQYNKKTIQRKTNYQKLVDTSIPRDGSIMGQRGSDKNNPCAIFVTDRRGKKMALPMPCEKFTKKDKWDKKYPSDRNCGKPCLGKPEKRNGQPGEEYLVCLPKNSDRCFRNEKPVDPDIGKKLVICMPCDKFERNEGTGMQKISPRNIRVFLPSDTVKKPARKQRDYMYRCESRELLGSKLLTYCECVKRNGLQDQCPRTPCLGRPACLEKPWPDCWPSGGCNGIDYDRPNGIQRVNPTLQYRRNNKECGPEMDDQPDVRVVIQQ